MKYTEIEVKSILNKVNGQDDWFGLTYNMNLYRGCEHQCIYCDTRSECYQIEDFGNEVLIKINGVNLLRNTLPKKKLIGTIGFGSINDPYTFAEAKYGLTGQALEVIAEQGWPVHIITKSDMVLKDLATLIRINKTLAQVSFTITTVDDDLAKKIEPGAPSPSRRLKAMKILAENGIRTGVTMMPVLPFILDTQLNLTMLVEAAHANKAAYILPEFGMTLRDRQREHYYSALDQHFPGIRQKYEDTFGEKYSATTVRREFLEGLFNKLCGQYGIATRIEKYPSRQRIAQLGLFD
jgi:DNA repair photolyase